MEQVIFTLFFLSILGFLFIRYIKSQKKISPYKRKEFFLNIPERKFFEEITKHVPKGYTVFPQVVLANIISVCTDKKSFWKYQNKINKKTIDFVIFKLPYFVPVLGIEYDGATHYRKDRKMRDLFVDEVLKKSGINILHINHSDKINYLEIRDRIKIFLSTNK